MTVDFNDFDGALALVDLLLDEAPLGSYYEGMDNEGRIHLAMDVAAANGVNGNPPLDMNQLMTDKVTRWHDVVGIHRHIDRETGQLTDCFLPRAARQE